MAHLSKTTAKVCFEFSEPKNHMNQKPKIRTEGTHPKFLEI